MLGHIQCLVKTENFELRQIAYLHPRLNWSILRLTYDWVNPRIDL